jgi:hypothetical protein
MMDRAQVLDRGGGCGMIVVTAKAWMSFFKERYHHDKSQVNNGICGRSPRTERIHALAGCGDRSVWGFCFKE